MRHILLQSSVIFWARIELRWRLTATGLAGGARRTSVVSAARPSFVTAIVRTVARVVYPKIMSALGRIAWKTGTKHIQGSVATSIKGCTAADSDKAAPIAWPADNNAIAKAMAVVKCILLTSSARQRQGWLSWYLVIYERDLDCDLGVDKPLLTWYTYTHHIQAMNQIYPLTLFLFHERSAAFRMSCCGDQRSALRALR